MRIFTLVLINLSLLILTCNIANSEDLAILFKQQIEERIDVRDPELKQISDFTFDELKELSQTATPKADLQAKLDNHLSMVYLVERNNSHKLDKPYLRIAHWNVERGLNVEDIKEILINQHDYENKHISNVKPRLRKNFKEELNTFANTDILCLNEIDIGMPRTKYKNIVSELGDTLNWDYAYATEFVEVGPLFQNKLVDKALYKGLHGNAIISKYPIISTKVIRIPNEYDWYRAEAVKRQSPLEHVRHFGAMAIFSEKIEYKEVRHGSRNALIADIQLPDGQIITVVSTHLEDRAYADKRLKQFKYLLENLKDKKTPVILAGDLNTSTTETIPTSLKKEVVKRIRDPHFVLRAAATPFIPGLPIACALASVPISKLLAYKDPFFPSIPIVFPNHERRFYASLKKFKFNDGNTFDLSGDKEKSSNRRGGLLANSNQRHWKGFKSTFKLKEPRLIAYFKLDWFFVKPVGEHFMPFNGKTLKTLNYSSIGHISDHNPITVDLTL
jgi:endonuclease/exonuclease/phosphatase family metal-dependent hydrolase